MEWAVQVFLPWQVAIKSEGKQTLLVTDDTIYSNMWSMCLLFDVSSAVERHYGGGGTFDPGGIWSRFFHNFLVWAQSGFSLLVKLSSRNGNASSNSANISQKVRNSKKKGQKEPFWGNYFVSQVFFAMSVSKKNL